VLEPLGATALLVPATKEGTWPGAGESPGAPTTAPFTVASSTMLLSAASLLAAAFSVASSAAPITMASSVALLSTAAITTAASGAAGVGSLPLSPTALKSSRSHFCRGVSSSDNTSSTSRMTRAYLPLPGTGAGVEPPRRHHGHLLGRSLLGCHHSPLPGCRLGRDHLRRQPGRRPRE
jgi:hypothetical protein